MFNKGRLQREARGRVIDEEKGPVGFRGSSGSLENPFISHGKCPAFLRISATHTVAMRGDEPLGTCACHVGLMHGACLCLSVSIRKVGVCMGGEKQKQEVKLAR